MQIVSDRGMDLSAEQMAGLDNIHLVPLVLTLEGKSYRSGEDIQPEEFYRLLEKAEGFPTTSQPSAGELADVYRRVAQSDPDILSVHISSGLSGTINAATEGAKLVPEANVTLFDTKTLSGAEGWHVEAAAQALKAGWPLARILELLSKVQAATETLFTLDDLKYLIHGGRISHIKGLLASILNIKPVIGVEKVLGKYEQRGQARTLTRAIKSLVDIITHQHAPGSELRIQVMHAHNPTGAEMLKEQLDKMFKCHWLPTCPIAPVLGAHTGPSLVGAAFARWDVFADLPWEKDRH